MMLLLAGGLALGLFMVALGALWIANQIERWTEEDGVLNAYHELAEAIRAGAAIRPQATNGNCFERRPLIEPGQCASCALGAAYESVVGPVQTWQEVPDWYEVAEEVYEAFPCISEPAPPCPEPTCQGAKVKSFHMSWDARDYVQDLINHLNDEHGWSREAIASWLDTL